MLTGKWWSKTTKQWGQWEVEMVAVSGSRLLRQPLAASFLLLLGENEERDEGGGWWWSETVAIRWWRWFACGGNLQTSPFFLLFCKNQRGREKGKQGTWSGGVWELAWQKSMAEMGGEGGFGGDSQWWSGWCLAGEIRTRGRDFEIFRQRDGKGPINFVKGITFEGLRSFAFYDSFCISYQRGKEEETTFWVCHIWSLLFGTLTKSTLISYIVTKVVSGYCKSSH